MTDHLLERLEHQEGMLRRDPSRHYLHAADAMRDARAELTRLRERERRLEAALWRIMDVLPGGEAFHIALEAVCSGDTAAPTPDAESEHVG